MTKLDDETLEAIRAAEAAQQRSVCDVPEGALPEALQQALARRIEVNAAQHKPGAPIVRVGGSDAKVRELEAPYSRRIARGTQTPSDDKPAGKAKSATKKATASRRAKTKKESS